MEESGNKFNDADISANILDYSQQRPEDPMGKICRSYPEITEEILHRISSHNLRYHNIAELTEKDLELFGIVDHSLRTDLIYQFSKLMKQEIDYEKYKSEINVQQYTDCVQTNINQQMKGVLLLLSITTATLNTKPITENVSMKSNIYISSVIKDTLRQARQLSKQFFEQKNKRIASKWTLGLAVLTLAMLCYKKSY